MLGEYMLNHRCRRHNCTVMIIVNAATNLANFRDEIISKLLEENYQVIIVSPEGKRLEPYKGMSNCTVCEVSVNRHGKNLLQDILLFSKYYSLMKKYKPICIMTYTIKPNIYGGLAARFLRIPYLINITGLGMVFNSRSILQKAIVMLYRRVIKHATNVFFQNETNRSMFIKLGIRFPCSVILPGSGVNLSINNLEPYPDVNEPIRFLFVARIMKEKGINELIGAAKEIHKVYPNVEFHVIGNCEFNYEQQVKKWNEEGIIIYHGAQPDVHSFMKDSHALIHPSYYMEGMSNVCLEAAATGRPVLTTNWLGCRETIDDGKTGILFEPRSVESLVEALQKFISMPYEERVEMGIAGRNKMERQFDRQFVVNAYMKEITRLAEY